VNRIPISEVQWLELAKASNYRACLLAKRSGISVRQLERIFKRQFSNQPQRWLDQQRLAQAKSMLLAGNSIKAVALNLGYKQSSHFCRQFKTVNEMTPSQFVSIRFAEGSCRREITCVAVG